MKKTFVTLLSFILITAPCFAQIKDKLSFHVNAGVYAPLLRNTEFDTRVNGALYDGGIGYHLSKRMEVLVIASFSFSFPKDDGQIRSYEGDGLDTFIFSPRPGMETGFEKLKLLSFTVNLKFMPWPNDWPNTYLIGGFGMVKRLNELRYSPTAPTYASSPYRSASKIGSVLQLGAGQIFTLTPHIDFILEGMIRANYIEYNSGDFIYNTARKTRLDDISLKTGTVLKW